MYYKVVKNNNVIDVLDRIVYLKYQTKHKIFLLCDESEAQAIQSSDEKNIWHVNGLYKLPIDGYDTVELIEIDEFEYKNLKIFQVSDPQSLIDQYTLLLIEMEVL